SLSPSVLVVNDLPRCRARATHSHPEYLTRSTNDSAMTPTNALPDAAAPTTDVGARRRLGMLALATVGFAVNFWAWSLLSPLGPLLKDMLTLSAFEQALVVAVPVIVGSLGRIPVGALTDRPVLFIGLGGYRSLTGLLVGGFFLGIGGAVFAVGIPFVSAWFPPSRRGLALGVYGAGMGGTAVGALTTVHLVEGWGMA